MLSWKFELAVHDRFDAALEWLGVVYDVARLDEGLAMRRRAAESEARLVERTRAWLSENLASATMAHCARALGVATRTLQRHLMEAQTTFRHLLQEERVLRAKALLAESDLKVGAVASEVGYPKLQSLAIAFRRATGMTPAEWRRAQRT